MFFCMAMHSKGESMNIYSFLFLAFITVITIGTVIASMYAINAGNVLAAFAILIGYRFGIVSISYFVGEA